MKIDIDINEKDIYKLIMLIADKEVAIDRLQKRVLEIMDERDKLVEKLKERHDND